MTARLSYLNLFARDMEAQARFYAAALGFPEVEALRSPIFRCLDAGGVLLGFNAHAAYELLNLADRVPQRPVTSAYATFELASTTAVDAGVKRILDLGGTLIKAPYRTYYNAYQAVLADPEGNVFRLNHDLKPG
ncbi:MAG: VOC family protein [Burkholderiales bacterium]|nr:VOC family protein [Burkholderiales bacterium]